MMPTSWSIKMTPTRKERKRMMALAGFRKAKEDSGRCHPPASVPREYASSPPLTNALKLGNKSLSIKSGSFSKGCFCSGLWGR